MEAVLTRVLVEVLAAVAQLAFLRLLAWLRERSTTAQNLAVAH